MAPSTFSTPTTCSPQSNIQSTAGGLNDDAYNDKGKPKVHGEIDVSSGAMRNETTVPKTSSTPNSFNSQLTDVLRTLCSPASQYVAPRIGRPPSTVKKGRKSLMNYHGNMKYKNRVREGLSKRISRKLIRDAQIALIAAAEPSHSRFLASYSLLNGTYIQRHIHENEAVFTDEPESDCESETDSGSENWKENDNQEEDKLNSDNSRTGTTIFSENVEKAVRQLDCAEEIMASTKGKGVIKEISHQVSRYAEILRKRSASCDCTSQSLKLSQCYGDEDNEGRSSKNQLETITQAATRAALYRTYATYWSWLLEKGDKKELVEDPTFSYLSSPLLECFQYDKDVLSCIFHSNSTTNYLASLTPASPDSSLMKALQISFGVQQRLLLDVMHVKDDDIAARLLNTYGTAKCVVRRCNRHDVHGFFDENEDEPLIGRFLHDLFGTDIQRAADMPFKNLVNLAKGKGILELKDDEIIRCYERIVKHVIKEDDREAKERLSSIWNFLKHVCMFVSNANCLEVVGQLVDDEVKGDEEETIVSKKGRLIFRRLACESAKQICKRCPSLSDDEARKIRHFAHRSALAPGMDQDKEMAWDVAYVYQ